jgi:hypothetical protein
LTQPDPELEHLKAEATDLVVLLDRFPAFIEKFLKITGRRETAFGKESTYGVDFVRLVRGGRDFRVSTIRKVADLISKEPQRNKVLAENNPVV